MSRQGRISDLTAAGIGEFGEVILNPCRLPVGHDRGSGVTHLTKPLLLLSKRRKCRHSNYAKLPSMAQSPCRGKQVGAASDIDVRS